MFCDINFKRKDGNITVLKGDGQPSVLFQKLTEYTTSNDVYAGRQWFFNKLITQSKLKSTDSQELALGLYSIAFHSGKSESYWLNKIGDLLPPIESTTPAPVEYLISDSLYSYSELKELLPEDEFYSTVNERLIDLNPKVKIKVTDEIINDLVEELQILDARIDDLARLQNLQNVPTGVAVSKSNKIFIASNSTAKTLTHELAHLTIQRVYEKDSQFKDTIDHLWEVSEKYVLDNNLEFPYGLVSPTEFLAESLSNQDFIQLLNQIPFENNSLFGRFVEIISTLLNKLIFESITPNSVLGKLTNEIGMVLDNNRSETQLENLKEIETSFENYFPDYSWMPAVAKSDLVDLVNDGKLTLTCSL